MRNIETDLAKGARATGEIVAGIVLAGRDGGGDEQRGGDADERPAGESGDQHPSTASRTAAAMRTMAGITRGQKDRR